MKIILWGATFLISIQSWAGDFVAVGKHAGGLQCSDQPGIQLETMKEELHPIPVLRMARKTEGGLNITLCGRPDGWFNVYWIRQADLELARQRGFVVFKTSVAIRSKIVLNSRHR